MEFKLFSIFDARYINLIVYCCRQLWILSLIKSIATFIQLYLICCCHRDDVTVVVLVKCISTINANEHLINFDFALGKYTYIILHT